jgi:hypothetical protein
MKYNIYIYLYVIISFESLWLVHTHAIRYVALWLVLEDSDYLVPDVCVEMAQVDGADR